ncbi:MAG TPA: neocarzinostatin apoprotein domain-containing protein [Acidimicrobiia bacterium]|nr:neocarzinostatin apoprotein domain-containing protein [Acidimicrobiia bacterium]
MRRAARASFATLAAALAVATLAACSGSSSRSTATRPTAATPRAVARQAVGVVTATYVDTSRPTPKSGPDPAQPRRTLVTTILYPATGPAGSTTPVRDAPPARRDGPFPLIVFAHGLGASPQVYEPGLLDQWVAAGYVVAAPQFPLTSSATPNGVDAADVVNQPGDVSFVITSILRASATRRGPLAGLVDPDRIGAAGHSNGAITTLGLVANTCCRDPRVKAAAVLAGDTVAFPNGRYDFVHAPPLLFVHGTDDALLPYAGIVSAFDEARGPKGLLTIEHGDHSSAAAGQRASSADVVRTTEDFFDAYLRDDGPARTRLARDGEPGVTTLDFVTTRGATATIPTIPEPPTQRRATVEPSRNLRDGQTVTVRWSGFTPGKVVNVVQCSRGAPTPTSCDLRRGRILILDPTGSGSLRLQVVTGTVGQRVCDHAHPDCFVAVNDASLQEPSATVIVPITFAP